jgi:hypothetical protein
MVPAKGGGHVVKPIGYAVVEFSPVVQSCAPQVPVVQVEAERANQP